MIESDEYSNMDKRECNIANGEPDISCHFRFVSSVGLSEYMATRTLRP